MIWDDDFPPREEDHRGKLNVTEVAFGGISILCMFLLIYFCLYLWRM